ncbi:hypothetical protein [Paraburkholderia tropica]|uniref:hypothetical protein n=1 Tax=Paraburkholderia tropica TaxID=92647 RepID=UPI001591CEA7|nr:hypothetical protein [Paraburkholderia tropica]
MHSDKDQIDRDLAATDSNERPNYTADASGLLRYLWGRGCGQVEQMADDELEWVATASENAQLMALNLSKTLGGVAMLISCDSERKGLHAGSFQPHDLPELLWGAADTVKTIEEMVTIAGDADFHLRERYRKRAEHLAHQASIGSARHARDDGALKLAAQGQVMRSKKQTANATEQETENA